MCKEKHVIINYDYVPGSIEVNNITGKMVEWPLKPFVSYWSMAGEWEVQAAFFETNNIKPTWINNNFTIFGSNDMIERDEADYAICCFSGTYEGSKQTAYSPGIDYLPYYWLTRYPLELPPTWNLVKLFTKGYISRMSIILYSQTFIVKP